MSILRITTANVRVDLEAWLAEKVIRHEIARGGATILNEVGDRAEIFDEIEQEGYYGVVRFEHASRRNNVIVYDLAELKKLRSLSTILHRSRLFRSANRDMTSAKFLHRASGRKIWINAVHFVPHADDARRPGWITRLSRRSLVLRAIAVVVGVIRRQGRFGAVVVTGGDFNIPDEVDRGQDPQGLQRQMARAGARSSLDVLGVPSARGTHGDEYLDAIYLRARPGAARFLSQRVNPKSFSDHRSLTVAVEMTLG